MKTKWRLFSTGLARNLAWLSIILVVVCADRQAHGQGAPIVYNTLNSWSFEETNFESDFGSLPTAYTNVSQVLSNGDGYSLLMDDTNAPAYLGYNVVDPDGATNLIVSAGTLILWFSPDWDSVSTNNGTGPGNFGRFIETGAYTTNADWGWWSVYTDPGGTNLYFSSQTNNGNGITYLSCPIMWTSNVWHSVALSYSSAGSTIFVDGITRTNGPGMIFYPGANVLSNGFWIGSDYTGNYQARGMFDDIQTIDTALNSNTVAALAGIDTIIYNNGGFLGLALTQAPSSPTNFPTFQAITGSGNLTFVGSASSCVYGTSAWNVWITNVSSRIVGSGTNATVSATFTIQGGVSGGTSLFDVFANAALSASSTNYQWAWEGQGYQCNTYTLTNLPTGGAYLILGTPKDSDQDGLTDAYEMLVSHTNPNAADSTGDGMLDGWKVLWGLSTSLNNTTQPSERSNYGYDGTDWLDGINAITGVRNGTVLLDAEGNVTQSSQ